MLGSATGTKGGLYPRHDLECESKLLPGSTYGENEMWSDCQCEVRRAERTKHLHKVVVYKVQGDDPFPELDPRVPRRMWKGWCLKCDKRVALYYDFGAALGASLEHQRRARS